MPNLAYPTSDVSKLASLVGCWGCRDAFEDDEAVRLEVGESLMIGVVVVEEEGIGDREGSKGRRRGLD
jgi:hypothetical protein